MRASTIFTIICLAAVNCSFVESFPALQVIGELPPGFAWQFQNASAFYIYRAVSSTDAHSVAGIYFGTAPNAFDTCKPERAGLIAGKRVQWCSSERGLETILPFKYDSRSIQLQLHVWVSSQNLETREALRTAVERARFVPRKPPN